MVDMIAGELRPHFDDLGHKFQNDFNGYKTLQLGTILALSRASAELIASGHYSLIIFPEEPVGLSVCNGLK